MGTHTRTTRSWQVGRAGVSLCIAAEARRTRLRLSFLMGHLAGEQAPAEAVNGGVGGGESARTWVYDASLVEHNVTYWRSDPP